MSDASSASFLGVEIGGTKLQIIAGTDAARVLERVRLPVDKTSAAEGIRRQLQLALPVLFTKWNPAAIGVGFGGPVNWRTGSIARSHQIEGWSDFDLGGWLAGISKLPVRVDNDANVAALAEARCGAGLGSNPVFYVTLGSGVGGGCVVNGRIFHGAAPGESEIGHVRLDASGVTVEQRCSGWAVDAKVRRLKTGGAQSVLCDWLPQTPGGEARLLAKALTLDDPAAQQILTETAQDLALALSHVTHLLHPEVIVLGGGLSLLGEPLRRAVATALPRFVMEVFAGGPQVKLAALGEDAVPVGALLLACEAGSA